MKLFLSDQLGYDEDKTRLLSEFILFCANKLPIENNFEVHVVSNREDHGITTTAVYEVSNNCCKIYGKGRAFVDVLRSIAHEMTHMMQDEMGLLVGHIQDAGGFHEDQANSKAGELIKLFAKSKEDRKAIYESSYNKKINYFTSYNLLLEKMDVQLQSQGDPFPIKKDHDHDDETLKGEVKIDGKDPFFDENGWVRALIDDAVKAGFKISSNYRGPNDQSRVAFKYIFVKDALAVLVSEDESNKSKSFYKKVMPGAYFFSGQSSWSECKKALASTGLEGIASMSKGVYSAGGPGSSDDISEAFNAYNTKEVKEELKKLYNSGKKDQLSLRKAAGNSPVCKKAIDDGAEHWKAYQRKKANNKKAWGTHMTGRALDMPLSSNITAFGKLARKNGVDIRPAKESDHYHVGLRQRESSTNESIQHQNSYNNMSEGMGRLNPTFISRIVKFFGFDGDETVPYSGKLKTVSGDKVYIGQPGTGLSPPGFWDKFRKNLEKHINQEYPDLGFRIGNLGVSRELKSAAVGGKGGAKIAGSKHGAGLAQDIYMHSKKYGEFKYFKEDNKPLAADKKFVDAIISFMQKPEQKDLRWGGAFSSGKVNLSPGDMPKDRGILELHHFEYTDKKVVDIFKPFEEDIRYLTNDTLGATDMTKSKKRAQLYVAIAASTKDSSGTFDSGESEENKEETENIVPTSSFDGKDYNNMSPEKPFKPKGKTKEQIGDDASKYNYRKYKSPDNENVIIVAWKQGTGKALAGFYKNRNKSNTYKPLSKKDLENIKNIDPDCIEYSKDNS
jgi:hypothetical protein